MIKISRYRYEQLLDLETRVNVAVERILHKEYMEMKEMIMMKVLLEEINYLM